jgi:peptidoglycan L-alanyl-D-glutamate endopeptidase CwlK
MTNYVHKPINPATEGFNFSEKSLEKLNTAHADLIALFSEVIKYRDCTVACGHRNEIDQEEAYQKKLTELKFPKSKHNVNPSLAVDVAPYIDGKAIFGSNQQEKNQMIYFAGFVLGVADRLFDNGIIAHKIRWGGDWDRNLRLDETFIDYPHFELIEA